MFTDRAEDLPLVSFTMLRDKEMSRKVNSITKVCTDRCPTRNCRSVYCITMARVTTTSGLLQKHDQHKCTVRVETTGQPDVTVIYQPKLPILDFVIYILSSLGTWFGLVIIACNPFDYVKQILLSMSDVARKCKSEYRRKQIRNRMKREKRDLMYIFINRHKPGLFVQMSRAKHVIKKR